MYDVIIVSKSKCCNLDLIKGMDPNVQMIKDSSELVNLEPDYSASAVTVPSSQSSKPVYSTTGCSFATAIFHLFLTGTKN